MSEHLTSERMNAYGRRSLSPADLLTADDHLAECPECRGGMSDEAGVQATIAALLQGILSAAPPVSARAAEALAPRDSAPVPAAAPAGPVQSAAAARPATDAATEADPILTSAASAASAPPRGVALVVAILIAVVLGLAAGGAWRRSLALERRLARSEEQLSALRESNQGLAGQAAELQSLRAEVEKARSEAATAPEPAAAPPPAAAVVTLQDRRGPVGLDAEGNLVGLDGLPLADGRVIAAALKTGTVDAPAALPRLLDNAATLAGADGATGFALLAPVATAVRSPRPAFTWRALEGGAEYTVEILDEAGGPVGKSDPLQRTSWTPSHPLRRGALYAWRVTARRGSEEIVMPAAPVSGARFRVVDGESVSALDRATRAAGGSRLVLGILAARAGLLDESERELRALRESNRSSPLVGSLLQSVEALRRPQVGG
jgi:hypothetical protein